jgi:hypothetical protein
MEIIPCQRGKRRKIIQYIVLAIVWPCWSAFIAHSENTNTTVDSFKRSDLARGEEANSPVKSFKTYLETQPPVAHILFLYRSTKLAKDGKSVVLPDNFQVFAGGWSTNGFYIRSLANPNASETPNTIHTPEGGFFVGRNGSNYWQINAVYVLRSQREDALHDAKNPVIRAALNFYLEITRAICMGIDGVEPGTLQWTNDAFIAEYRGRGIAERTTVRDSATGEKRRVRDPKHVFGVMSSSQGLPTQLEVRRFDDGAMPTILTYKYTGTNTLPMGLPDDILTQFHTQEGLKTASEMIILSLTLGDAAAPPTFDPGLLC